MKKTLRSVMTLLLILSCLLTVCACSDGSASGKDTEAAGSTAAETETEPAARAAFERGDRGAENYRNDSVGIDFKLPAGWIFYTDEQLAQLTNMSAELYKDKDILSKVDVVSLYEFMAVDLSTNSNIIMMTEKTALPVTAEQYLTALRLQIASQYQEGLFNVDEKTSKVDIAGSEWTYITAVAQNSGITMNQYYLVRPMGSVVIAILITDVSGADLSYYTGLLAK